MHEYSVKYTRLAKAFLGESLSAFEEQLRGELANDLPDDVYPPDIFFHSLEYNGKLFIATGKGDHLSVDTATLEEIPAVKSGPFKGRRLQVPVSDTEG